MIRFAEDANYWSTTVHPAKSQAEIIKLLEDFGAGNYQLLQGRAGTQTAWLIRFEWNGHSYRFIFTPLECKSPDSVRKFGDKRRTHREQSRYQMGRIAVHFTKAILTAAEAHPHALFGFMEIPDTEGSQGIPLTAGELDISGVISSLQIPAVVLALPRAEEP